MCKMANVMQSEAKPRWDLTRLYVGPADPLLVADRERARELVRSFVERYRNQFSTLDSAALSQALDEMETPVALLDRLAGYTWLLFYTDTRDEAARALYQDVWAEYTMLKTELDHFKTELRYLSAEAMTQHLEAPALERYRYWLIRIFDSAPYARPSNEERILANRTITGVNAWCQLLTESLARLRLTVMVDGQPNTVSVSEARGYRSDLNRVIRDEAHQRILAAFAGESHLLTYIFNTLMQEYLDELSIRNMTDLLTPRLLEYDLSRAAVDSLLRTTRKHYGLSGRYYRSKARLLGIADFGVCDLVAPPSIHHSQVSFNTARVLVQESLRQFSPEFAEMAERFFAEAYIDAFPAPGKPSGSIAFGLGPTVHPYLFLNYTSSVRDVVLLAHELGHGLHFLMAARKQGVLNAYSTSPMLETVSIFTEMLTAEHLLTLEPNPHVRIHVLAAQIENALLNVMRQTMYTEWELAVYTKRQAGFVSAADLNGCWLDAHKTLYGDSVQVTEADGWGWLNNPYFFTTRFGNFSYAFGQLLVLSLFTQFKRQGKDFVDRFMDMLEQGGSESPAHLLARIGIDIENPQCWEKGFVVLEELIEEFERAVDELTPEAGCT
jgi:oligoendopeptidase F